jgi:hypothetical protein
MDAEDWLTDTERKLEIVGCNDEEKVGYATYHLSGPAASWWESVVAIHPSETRFTWEAFKEKFRAHHVPESIMELKQREFETLQQGDQAIPKYLRDFSHLSRYAHDEVNTKEKMKKRFIKGLNPYLRMQLRTAAIQGFQHLVDTAITFEDDYLQVYEKRKRKGRREPRKFQPNKTATNVSFKSIPRTLGGTPNKGVSGPHATLFVTIAESRVMSGVNVGNPGSFLWMWTRGTHET